MAQDDSETQNSQDALASAQLQKLLLEIEELHGQSHWAKHFARYIPLATVIVTVAGLCFGIYQFGVQQEAASEARLSEFVREREARTLELDRDRKIRERELFKPLWEQQINLYFRASEAVATIATSNDENRKAQAIEDFWNLYQGPLVVVESPGVSGAMVNFGKCLDGEEKCDPYELKKRSRALATQVQESLSKSWADGLGGFSKDKYKYH
jgi:hypothetical protein